MAPRSRRDDGPGRAEAIDARSSAWWLLTAWMTAAQKNRNCRFSEGVSPGSSRFNARVGAHRPVVVLARAVDARERLLVQQAHQAIAAGDVLHHLHRQLWWSQPTFEFSKIGATSYWLGATSLWRVLTGTPSLASSSSVSSMYASIRSGIEPK